MPGFDASAQLDLTLRLKAEARRLGFDDCGISSAEPLDEEARRLEQWLLEGRYATMEWMANHFDKRTDPTQLVEGAQSVISVLHNYYQPDPPEASDGRGKISRYAWGDDYHEVMKDKLYRLYQWLQEEVGTDVNGRAFVDSAPVMDKAWAARSGLGWQGKNTLLLNREMGSYFFLGELIVDVPLTPDAPVPDSCGSCTRCLDACPTDALYEPYALDASRCISYLTIEHRGFDVPDEIREELHNWIFGCDICQQVCPWNKFSRPTQEPRYEAREDVRDTDLHDWVEMNLDAFEKRFQGTPVTRAGYEGFQRNVRNAMAKLESTS
ncbi:tRNA epoxyqueuosine(34) reductase QueG [Longibacter salinarum]|uniref:Epoxyqueuosine reductase n=1 Tax=Longibacter salinarum TaxID=1850348 RepID=A0A2A8CXZ3_9BACT|nr:tRNA epoxyqueuosine(34) reductase QueG [Longibacter salinarum]PEN13565.1 tRNA epoxyqueuosine(34) reductase QueG [Longibacter salinarum]